MCVVLKQSVRCRWGYKHVEELADVVAKYKAADIPLEVMWTDIDYMDGYRDFSLDPNNFSKDKMQARLHVCVAVVCAVWRDCMQRCVVFIQLIHTPICAKLAVRTNNLMWPIEQSLFNNAVSIICAGVH